MARWEYHIALLSRSLDGEGAYEAEARRLAALGEDGWELVAINGRWGYFKRPRVAP